MDIIFSNGRIRKTCNNATNNKLKRRLDDLRAANNLFEMQMIPGKTHPLRENRSGQWAIDLEQPRRLIFKPVNSEPNGWDGAQEVTSIKIIEIVDYHG